jgi:cytochrome c
MGSRNIVDQQEDHPLNGPSRCLKNSVFCGQLTLARNFGIDDDVLTLQASGPRCVPGTSCALEFLSSFMELAHMKVFKSLLSLGLGLGLLAFGGALRANEPTEKDAIAMVDKAAAELKKSGFEALKAKIAAKDAEFNRGELYVYIRGLDGTTLAHPNAGLVGKNLVDVPDVDGKLFRKEIVELAKSKGRGWVDYKFKNPASGKVEAKTTYILRQGDHILEAGIYK